MKLRVAHLITQLELGGAQQNTLFTVGHLNLDQYEPILICGPGGLLDEESRAGAWPTYFVRWLVRPVRPWKDAMALVSIYRLLRQIKPHIVHTHSSKAGIIGRLAAYAAGVPVIIHTFHGFGFTPGQPAWLRKLFVLAERFCACLSTHLVFVSKDNEEEAARLRIGRGKSKSLIRSGILVQSPPAGSSIRQDLGIPKEAWVVISVGNFKPQKNPLALATTAKRVLDSDPSIHFLWVGDGELRSAAEEDLKAHALFAQIHFLGWRRDIPSLLAASDCFILTSLWEGLPRALVEAALARLPSVAFAVNGVNDILIEGETGFPIPPQNTELAADKLLWLKNHPLEARLMGQKARRQVELEFDINRMVRQQEQLYQELYEAVPLKAYYEPLWSNPPK